MRKIIFRGFIPCFTLNKMLNNEFIISSYFTGISGRSQLLFAVVYTTRYLDLFFVFISVYNSAMKVMFIAASYGTLYLIYVKFKVTYDRTHDTFKLMKYLSQIQPF